MKRKNKGFALTVTIYSLFMIFVLILFYILYIISSTKTSSSEIKKQILNDINNQKERVHIQFIVNDEGKTIIEKKLNDLNPDSNKYEITTEYTEASVTYSETPIIKKHNTDYFYYEEPSGFAIRWVNSHSEIGNYYLIGVIGNNVIYSFAHPLVYTDISPQKGYYWWWWFKVFNLKTKTWSDFYPLGCQGGCGLRSKVLLGDGTAPFSMIWNFSYNINTKTICTYIHYREYSNYPEETIIYGFKYSNNTLDYNLIDDNSIRLSRIINSVTPNQLYDIFNATTTNVTNEEPWCSNNLVSPFVDIKEEEKINKDGNYNYEQIYAAIQLTEPHPTRYHDQKLFEINEHYPNTNLKNPKIFVKDGSTNKMGIFVPLINNYGYNSISGGIIWYETIQDQSITYNFDNSATSNEYDKYYTVFFLKDELDLSNISHINIDNIGGVIPNNNKTYVFSDNTIKNTIKTKYPLLNDSNLLGEYNVDNLIDKLKTDINS